MVMKHKLDETIYIIGESRTHMDNAITVIYNSFYVGFIVDVRTDMIVDAGCTHTIQITEEFLKEIFIGRNILDFESLEREIKRRYHGTSQKAVIVSLKDAIKKYQDVKIKFYQ